MNASDDQTGGVPPLNRLLDRVPCGLVLAGPGGAIIYANPRAHELLGEPAGALLGRRVRPGGALHLPGAGQGKALVTKELAGGKMALYRAAVPPGQGGGEMYIFDRLSPEQLTALARDLLEDHQHLKNLISQFLDLDETLHSVFESFYDGIMFVEDQQVVRVNSAFSRITGIKGESLLGRAVEDLDGRTHVCLDTIQRVHRLVGQLNKSITLMGKLKQGHEIYVTGTPVMVGGRIQYVILNIRDITELKLLEEEVSRLMALYLSTPEEARIGQLSGGEIVAENRVMRGILDMIVRVAQVDSVVLFEGESGTGKEILARLIHDLGKRKKGPFISVNCGAIPETLFESELFGYERGAFTGADREGKPGLFELADGGVIFLDEIGELPLNCQVKLLKVIEDLEVTRVGGRRPLKLDVRIIAATNRNLRQMVKESGFREDLFYRLYVVPIKIPPLRERREDIFPLAWHFLRKFNKRFNMAKKFSHEAVRVLECYQWPGNVRELENVVERMLIMSEGEMIEPEHLPPSLRCGPEDDGALIQVRGIMPLAEAREAVEEKLLAHALAIRGTTREVARLLGVNHSTVVRKLKKYGLGPEGDDEQPPPRPGRPIPFA